MRPEDLEAAWGELHRPPSETVLAARGLGGAGIWAALDRQGLRHLLLAVPEGTEAPDTATRGLRMTVAAHQVAGDEPAHYLDLTCLSPAAVATFTAVAADIAAAGDGREPSERAGAVVEALARWRWFWGVDDGLSEREALGLFGELWFLHRWTPVSADDIRAWTASSGARHDFQWVPHSVEVKVARHRADGAVIHRIHNLEQLADPEQGELLLFSLEVAPDELARNTLPGLVDLLTARLAVIPDAAEEFARRLAQRGFSPVHRRLYTSAWRILSETLYAVGDGFPRLTAQSFSDPLPAGVSGISYSLDMAVCAPWRVASRPTEWPASGGAAEGPPA